MSNVPLSPPGTDSDQLLSAISQALAQFINEANPFILFNGLLDNLLSLTGSEYGFIGEVFYSDAGAPYIQSYATSNIAWSEETRQLYQDTAAKGMVFGKLDTLYGEVLKTGRYVIANDPARDPRAGGVPEGHPPLDSFLGLPIFAGDKLLGVVGIANRSGGYQHELLDYLKPFVMTCGNLILGYRTQLKLHRADHQLLSYQKRLTALRKQQLRQHQSQADGADIDLGDGYRFSPGQQRLTYHGGLVELTRKELLLIDVLAAQQGSLVSYLEVDEQLWPNVVVSESSRRSLLKRLRKKTPLLRIKTVSGLGYRLGEAHAEARD